MTVDLTDSDFMIAALRRSHYVLDSLSADLDDLALALPTQLPGWPVAQILSHLGSGAEIGVNILRRAEQGIASSPDRGAMAAIWDRWNGLTPGEQRDGRTVFDREHLEILDRLDARQRRELNVPYFVGPLTVAQYAGYRLSEHAVHTWDLAVALDPDARIDATAVPVLVARLGLIATRFHHEPTRRRLAPLRIALTPTDAEPLLLTVTEGVVELGRVNRSALDRSTVDGTVEGAAEVLVRLVYGRLDPALRRHDVLTVTDAVPESLAALFPGY